MSEVSTAVAQNTSTVKRESIINNEPKLHPTFNVGDVSYQGDVIIVCIGKLPKSAKIRQNRQLADGNTIGSRHVLVNGTVYDCDKKEVIEAIKKATKCEVGEQYIGPVFVSPPSPTAFDLDHPEHGCQGFPAGSICAVVFQRNLDAEEREQRTRD